VILPEETIERAREADEIAKPTDKVDPTAARRASEAADEVTAILKDQPGPLKIAQNADAIAAELAKLTPIEQQQAAEDFKAMAGKLSHMSIGERAQYLDAALAEDVAAEDAADAEHDSVSDATTDIGRTAEEADVSEQEAAIIGHPGNPDVSSYMKGSRASVVAESHMDVERSTIIAHGESEAHQDLREYARLAAWELPLLHSKQVMPDSFEHSC
jgi:hypothetical protein